MKKKDDLKKNNDSKKEEDCLELKNIKYQTMLLNHNSNLNETFQNTNNIETFLEKEIALKKKKQWNKLSIGSKHIKIKDYADKYSKENNLSDINKQILLNYLLKALDRKKLQKVKDIDYDVDKGVIKNIPNLTFNRNLNKFTIKKKNNNSSILKNLAPKTHRRKRVKNKKSSKEKKKQLKDKKKL